MEKGSNKIFIIIRLVLFFFLIFATIPSLSEEAWQTELHQIDREIQELKELKEKYESSAERNENNALRWQFRNETYKDARDAWDRAERDRAKVKELEEQITEREKKRAEIIRKHS
ncbi:MAG: hypothetical protein L0207_04785 [Chlamydiae bacterium]|nr:hypothetical protein [Chlamydiota bacterium]